MNSKALKSVESSGQRSDWLDIVRQQVQSLQFGVVQIVVHDSQVTQIEKTERVRMGKLAAKTFEPT